MNRFPILFFILLTALANASFAADDLCEGILQSGGYLNVEELPTRSNSWPTWTLRRGQRMGDLFLSKKAEEVGRKFLTDVGKGEQLLADWEARSAARRLIQAPAIQPPQYVLLAIRTLPDSLQLVITEALECVSLLGDSEAAHTLLHQLFKIANANNLNPLYKIILVNHFKIVLMHYLDIFPERIPDFLTHLSGILDIANDGYPKEVVELFQSFYLLVSSFEQDRPVLLHHYNDIHEKSPTEIITRLESESDPLLRAATALQLFASVQDLVFKYALMQIVSETNEEAKRRGMELCLNFLRRVAEASPRLLEVLRRADFLDEDSTSRTFGALGLLAQLGLLDSDIQRQIVALLILRISPHDFVIFHTISMLRTLNRTDATVVYYCVQLGHPNSIIADFAQEALRNVIRDIPPQKRTNIKRILSENTSSLSSDGQSRAQQLLREIENQEQFD